jgi:hypothetical protein
VEEATAATESMKAQSAALLQLVSRFRLSGEPAEGEQEGAATSSFSTAGSYISAPRLPPVLSRLLPASAVVPRPDGGWREF